MSEDAFKPYYKQPEFLRTLDDDAFSAVCDAAVRQWDFMFIRGVHAEEFGYGFPGGETTPFAVRIVEGENQGQVVFCTEFPRDWMLLGRILAEEHLTRTFANLSGSILADMLIRRRAYSEIWESFGEYSVFKLQYKLFQRRQFTTLDHPVNSERSSDPDPVEVKAFRNEFAAKVAWGTIEAITPNEIASEGITLFGKKYKHNESGLINGLTARFHSKLRFVGNRSVSDRSPYQFVLGYGSVKQHETRDGHTVGVVSNEYTVAHSPALAPDLMGWTPIRKQGPLLCHSGISSIRPKAVDDAREKECTSTRVSGKPRVYPSRKTR